MRGLTHKPTTIQGTASGVYFLEENTAGKRKEEKTGQIEGRTGRKKRKDELVKQHKNRCFG